MGVMASDGGRSIGRINDAEVWPHNQMNIVGKVVFSLSLAAVKFSDQVFFLWFLWEQSGWVRARLRTRQTQLSCETRAIVMGFVSSIAGFDAEIPTVLWIVISWKLVLCD